MKRNLIVVPLLVIAFVAFQIVPPAQAEPITLTIMAIAGIATVMTAASADMAVHGVAITQANSPKEMPAEVYAKDRSADSLKNHDAQATTTVR
ncbi:MAG TPA: hypothetical protein VLR50_07605 [Desulfobacterales bacterium]|nr:hypothetical protein [Desulfobacterales bacterium]